MARDIVQLFGDILAHLAQGAAAATTSVTGRQDFIFPVQMIRQWLAIVMTFGARFGRGVFVTGRLLGLLLACGLRDLIVFRQIQSQLVYSL